MSWKWIAAAAAAGSLVSAGLASAGTEAPARGVAIEDFLAPAALSRVSISPSGGHLAMVMRDGDVVRLVVQDLATGQARALMEASSDESFGGTGFDWFHWKDDDRLLVAARLVEVQRRRGADDGRVLSFRAGRAVIAMARDGSGYVQLEAPGADPGNPGEVIDVLANQPNHILMTVEDWTGALDVVRVDIRTGEAERVLNGDQRTLSYYTDRDGAIVGRIRRGGLSGRVRVIESRDGISEGWTEIAQFTDSDLREMQDFEILGAAERPGELFVAVRPESGASPDTLAVHTYDMGTRTLGPVVWRHEQYDLSGIIQDVETGRFLAGCYRADVRQCDFVESAFATHMQALTQFFENSRNITLVSQTDDNSKWVLFVTGPDEPGTYYLYDLDAHSVDVLGEAFGRLALDRLGEMRRVDYTARDGAGLHGYLTAPPGDRTAPAPLIVMPHGGPEVRDGYSYDLWAQFLASRGYQVFQPNFRGSSGFGRAFAEAGHGQWGGLMQDDVTDGVNHLIAEGLAHPQQICILGASYGGYAALWGGASQPDLYRCVVSIAGVSDLIRQVRWDRSIYGRDSPGLDYAERSIGRLGQDDERMRSVSPVRFAETWRPPVLLIHGDGDPIVAHEQSREMERALRRAGKDVRLITLDGEGHSNWRRNDHELALTEIEAFLARHLPVVTPGPSDQP